MLELKATREHLVHLLTEASEIEHNFLCSYVYAAVSLKRKHEGLSPGEGDAVERWRQSVMDIAIEEMAHLALVNNLLVSIGGAACFDRPNFPIPPGYHPANIVIRLTPFSEATLAHFVYLEHPEDIDIQDHPDFTWETHYTRLPVGYGLTPSTPDYATVGGFYAAIRAAIYHLADSEASLFVGANG